MRRSSLKEAVRAFLIAMAASKMHLVRSRSPSKVPKRPVRLWVNGGIVSGFSEKPALGSQSRLGAHGIAIKPACPVSTHRSHGCLPEGTKKHRGIRWRTQECLLSPSLVKPSWPALGTSTFGPVNGPWLSLCWANRYSDNVPRRSPVPNATCGAYRGLTQMHVGGGRRRESALS